MRKLEKYSVKTFLQRAFIFASIAIMLIIYRSYFAGNADRSSNEANQPAKEATSEVTSEVTSEAKLPGGQNIQDVAAASGKSVAGSGASTEAAVSMPTTGEDPELQIWIQTESKDLNVTGIDPKAKDIELKRKIETLSEDGKKQVLKLALDGNQAATARILSAYMLVLDQSKDSFENLAQLAKEKLPNLGPITAHSEAEVKRGQELAVRYMAIDELSRRARAGDNLAKDEISRLTQSAESPEVRGYAQRVLSEIK